MISSFDDISTGKPFPPVAAQTRTANIAYNRDLYNGSWARLGIALNDDVANKIFRVKHNWFRTIPAFYSDFIFADGINISYDGESRANELIELYTADIISAGRAAFVDMIRYGTGVMAYNPFARTITAYEPDSWFRVVNRQLHYEGDVIAFVVDRPSRNGVEVSNEKLLYVYSLRNDGVDNSTFAIYEYDGAVIGKQIHTQSLSDIANRVANMDSNNNDNSNNVANGANDANSHNSDFPSGLTARNIFVTTMRRMPHFNNNGVSLYDDIKGPVGEIARRMTGLSGVLQQNQRPHMYGPISSVKQDANGNAQINTQGNFFPLQQGDEKPGYMQWDSDIEAVKADIQWQISQIFNVAGLSRYLFADDGDSNQMLTDLSGAAMRRVMLPLYAKLSTYKSEIESAMRQMFVIVGANNAERIDIDPRAISFDWQYEELFNDEMPQTAPVRAPNNNEGE